MVLAPDGITGYISSNRKSGYGDFDIYRVFFKQPVLAHLQISLVPTYYQLQLLHGKDEIQETPERPVEVKEYFLSHLFIEESGDVLSPQNIKKLDLLANLLLIYPKIHAELSGFELPAGQQSFNLYFSIKKVEKAAEYLERKGIQRGRLILKGYGASFPLVVNQMGAQPNPIFLKLNHRMEIGLHHFENEPVETHIEFIPVPENLKDPRGESFESLRHGLFYSVQLVSISQILQNPNLESLDELFIEVDNTQGNYQYMTGILPLYAEAEERLQRMIDLGFSEAYIVPYVDGLRISDEAINGLTEQYPDLLVYLAKSKK
jgi:outer membrane protein OmpA-like peptidoglycan-associated protein